MNLMRAVREVKISIDFGDAIHSLGRLAIRDGQIYFEYEGCLGHR